jgi:hypothetical protein
LRQTERGGEDRDKQLLQQRGLAQHHDTAKRPIRMMKTIYICLAVHGAAVVQVPSILLSRVRRRPYSAPFRLALGENHLYLRWARAAAYARTHRWLGRLNAPPASGMRTTTRRSPSASSIKGSAAAARTVTARWSGRPNPKVPWRPLGQLG